MQASTLDIQTATSGLFQLVGRSTDIGFGEALEEQCLADLGEAIRAHKTVRTCSVDYETYDSA
jgi:hypothetical protein